MNNSQAHQKLVNEIMLEIGSLPHVRIWKRVVGFDYQRQIKYGIVGESDIQGIIAPSGRMLCIEVKTGTAKLTKEQRFWQGMIVKFGGVHIVARSLSQALDDLNKQI